MKRITPQIGDVLVYRAMKNIKDFNNPEREEIELLFYIKNKRIVEPESLYDNQDGIYTLSPLNPQDDDSAEDMYLTESTINEHLKSKALVNYLPVKR